MSKQHQAEWLENRSMSSMPSKRPGKIASAAVVLAVSMVTCRCALSAPTAQSSTSGSATRLRGPLPDIAAFCETLPKGKHCFARGDDENPPAKAKRVPAPYRAIETFVAGDVDSKRLYVALQLAEGWFIYESPIESLGAISTVELAVRKLPDGKPVVVSRTVQSWASSDEDDRRATEHCTQYLLLCGVGQSGRPSCIAPLAIAGGVCDTNNRAATRWDWHLGERFVGGSLELKAAGKITEVDGQAAVGTHPLNFM
jgi:hypothetical protein